MSKYKVEIQGKEIPGVIYVGDDSKRVIVPRQSAYALGVSDYEIFEKHTQFLHGHVAAGWKFTEVK